MRIHTTMRRMFRFCYLIFFLMLYRCLPVRAYVDPSVMTYAIQAIAGVMIALGTFFGVYWRRIRQVLFGSQASSSATDEPDVFEFKDPASGAVQNVNYPAPETAVTKRKLSILPGVLLSVAMGFMLCLYKPLEIYFTNIHEFEYDIYAIFKYIFLFFLAVTLVILLVFLLSRLISRKLYAIVLLLGVIAFIAFYIQGNILIADLPPADGSVTDWSQYRPQEIQSIILWAASAVICTLIFLKFKAQGLARMVSVVSIMVSAILSVTLIFACVQNNGLQHKTQICISNENMHVMSSDKNIVIFVVDAMDSTTFHDLLNTIDPEYKDVFEDFTYYPDTLGAYPWTKLAVPQLLTGQWYECQDEFREWYIKALQTSPFLNRIHEENYVTGMYDQMDVIIREEDLHLYENVSIRPYGIQNPMSFIMDEARMIFFMYMPYQLKKYEPYALFNLTNQWPADYYFTWHDDATNQYFIDHPIETVPEKKFRFIHIEGAHPPYKWDKDLNDIEDTGTATFESNLQAAVTVLNTYLKALKEGNAFDNTAIVILGDHGYEDKIHSHTRQNPFLMIKGWGEKHDLIVSDLPISYDYLPEIYQNLMDGKTGKDVIPAIAETNPPRRYMEFHFDELNELTELELKDAFANDVEALKPTGRIYRR